MAEEYFKKIRVQLSGGRWFRTDGSEERWWRKFPATTKHRQKKTEINCDLCFVFRCYFSEIRMYRNATERESTTRTRIVVIDIVVVVDRNYKYKYVEIFGKLIRIGNYTFGRFLKFFLIL